MALRKEDFQICREVVFLAVSFRERWARGPVLLFKPVE